MRRFVLAAVALGAAATAYADTNVTYTFDDGSGLSAEVEFTLSDPMTLIVRARNTSTSAPVGFDSADQLLTGVSWDYDELASGGAQITGGSVRIGGPGKVRRSLENL